MNYGNRFYVLLILAIGFTVNACEKEPIPEPEPEPDPVSFNNEVQPIFTTYCAYSGCHDPSTESAQLDLTDSASYAELVNTASFLFSGQTRIIPSDTINSVLIKLIKGQASPRMPFFSTALSDQNIETITTWVAQGANNN